MSRRNFFRDYQREVNQRSSDQREQRREARRLASFPYDVDDDDDDDDDVLRFRRTAGRQDYVPARVGHRRYVSQDEHGSRAFEEEVTPDDLEAEYSARSRYLRERREADNDYYQLAMREQQRRDEMALAMQRQGLYANRDFLNYQLELQKERNRQENERRRQEYEREKYFREAEEAERQRTALALAASMQRHKEVRQQKRAGNDDLLSQLLEELNITPRDLNGISFFNGHCYSRSTLYKGYLTTILFVGYDNVELDPESSENYLVAYSPKGMKRIKYKRDNYTCLVHIHRVPNRRLFIVDICGYPEELQRKKKVPTFDIDGNEQEEPPKKSLFGRMMGYIW